ncbi:hypothetical protein FHN55_14475, partial [Streptomyces sp. NP160]|uniref:hypothetical protein n=1 Tax=Streptomyces sp. NP160 TaxID=2586637 RepID=UPI00111974AA
MSSGERTPGGTPSPAPPQRRRRRRVPGVLTPGPLRGPRPERHRPARDAITAAGRLPGPAAFSEQELAAAYDHLDEDLRPICGPDEATDAAIYTFCCWLAHQDPSTREAV